jgi:hypothetical protein
VATKHYTRDPVRQIVEALSESHDAKILKQRFSQFSTELIKFLEIADRAGAALRMEVADTEADAVTRLKKIVACRAIRNKMFGSDLFADPAWDIMLDLAIARAEDRRISISSLCIAANVPATTALRCIKSMADKNIIVLIPDRRDSRRKFAILSENVCEAMLKFALSIPL